MKQSIKRHTGLWTVICMLVMLFTASQAVFAASTVYLADTADEGNNQYASFKDAVAAVDPGGTIVLLEDMSESVTGYVLVTKTIIFDTNGYSYTITSSASETCFCVEGGRFKTIGTGSFNSGGIVAAKNGIIDITGSIVTSGESGIGAFDGSTVTFTGDVMTDATYGVAVLAMNNSSITVNGNVTSQKYVGTYSNGATIAVNGNVKTGDDGVVADNSTIIINGNITAGNRGAIFDNSIITVYGDVYAKDVGIDAGDSDVTINGNVNSESISDSGMEIIRSNATITGNVVNMCGDGVRARQRSTVTIGGDVIAEKSGVWIAGGASATDMTTVYIKGSVSAKEIGVTSLENTLVKIEGTLIAPDYIEFWDRSIKAVEIQTKEDGITGTDAYAGYMVYQCEQVEKATVLIKITETDPVDPPTPAPTPTTTTPAGVPQTGDTNILLVVGILLLLSGMFAVIALPKLARKKDKI